MPTTRFLRSLPAGQQPGAAVVAKSWTRTSKSTRGPRWREARTVTVTGELDNPTARFDGPAEAVVRLLSGRLGAEYAAGVPVTGNVTLDELRKVFPGY